jgi:hypothetical protein
MSTTANPKMTGFLDGYMAGNIAANEPELQQHTDKIVELLTDVDGKLSSVINKSDIAEPLSTAISKFRESVPKPEADVDSYNYFASELQLVVSQIKAAFPDGVPTEILSIIKRAIYHLLVIAKTLQDARVVESAKKIANQFV